MSPAAAVATSGPDASTCVEMRRELVLSEPAPSLTLWLFRPQTPSPCQTTSATIRPPFWIRSATPLTALHFDVIGEDVLVTGAGPIGLMAAAICRHVGARFVVITDPNTYRLELASKFGVSRAIDPEMTSLEEVMSQLGMLEGFDVGLEVSGSEQALIDMLDAMIHGGKIAVLGLPSGTTATDWKQIIFKGLTIKGIYGRQIFETWYKMTTLLQSGLDVSGVITHHFPADEFEEAFAVVSSGMAGKVLLDWA